MARLELKSLQKSYGSVNVIRDISLSIDDGEFVVFVGPSGCGKSTLLRMVAGLEGISGGELWIGNQLCNEIEPRDRSIAMVFQNYALYPHLSVYDNMGFGLKLNKTPKDIRDRKIQEAARILQIEHLLQRKPGQLSGGQRQRVAIGRAIVRNPGVFLFDEPLSNLDAALRTDMRMELAKLHQDLGATMIYVTHDQVEAMTLADKIVVLNGGNIQQIGSPIELYKRPANLFVASFIGSPKMNLLSGRVDARSDGFIDVTLPNTSPIKLPLTGSSLRAGDKVTLGVRPQALELSEDGQLRGAVALIERLGSETNVKIDLLDGGSILAVLDGDRGLQPGQQIACGFPLGDAVIFDVEGQAHYASLH